MMTEKLRIFYLDDDADDRFLFQEALSELSIDTEVTVLEDGEALLHLLENPPPTPNLIFVDLNMPRKNGYQVLTEIKSNRSLKQFSVVVLTTSSEKTVIESTRQLGADAFITKPESFNSLKTILNKCLTLNWREKSKNDFVIKAN
jgi:CheY-like chemotaxis protein